MNCHKEDKKRKHHKIDEKNLKRVLLMGNPNVGKSVIFSRLTGVEVMAANYAGTTVSFTKGRMDHQGQQALLIDVPGTYSTKATSRAEEVAVEMLEEGADLIICVLDATNLERNLVLAMEVQQYGIPVVFALNLMDVAKKQGIEIDSEQLSTCLNAPVIETIAVKNKGLDTLKALIFQDHFLKEAMDVPKMDEEQMWEKASQISEETQKTVEHKTTFMDQLGDAAMKPFPGIPLAILVLAAALGLVVGGGKAIRSLVLLPLVQEIVLPFIERVVSGIVPEGMLLNVLVGEYGVMIKMIEWPFALILPYVFLFYIVISFLEDSGYLPRLGVLMDSMLRKLGLPGGNIVPFIMGYGCAVPAILGTRASTSKKERIILASLIALAVPCTAQTGAFFTLLGDRSIFALIFVYAISFIAIMGVGVFLKRAIPGKMPPLLLEIPNLLLPDFKSLTKKIWIRLKHFLHEAQVPMFLGILLAALIAETGALEVMGRALQPLVEGWLGLPKEASLALLLGVIRRELTVMPLLDMNLTTFQVITGSVVALFYLPCLSVFAVLIKEFKLKIALLISVSTIVFAFMVGGLLNQIFRLIQQVIG